MERGGRGLNPPSSFPSPGNDSHSLPSQVLIKQEKNAPAWMYIDSYVATHRRVSREWQVAADPAARGNGSTRAAGAESRAAESRAQGHLTRGEPKRKLRAERQGAGRPGHRTAPPGSGRERLQAAAEVPAHRLRLLGAPLLPPPPPSPPSPPLPGLASSGVADFGSSPEEAGSSLASAREWFPLRAFCLSSSTFQPHTPRPPPVIASQTNMAAPAAAAAGAAARARVGNTGRARPPSQPPPPRSLPRGHRMRHYGDHPRASREV